MYSENQKSSEAHFPQELSTSLQENIAIFKSLFSHAEDIFLWR
ncbi:MULTISPECIES: hypothetical protein [Brevibacillus]|nr:MULTISPECIES: hypothetical protein [Brevibacillus]